MRRRNVSYSSEGPSPANSADGSMFILPLDLSKNISLSFMCQSTAPITRSQTSFPVLYQILYQSNEIHSKTLLRLEPILKNVRFQIGSTQNRTRDLLILHPQIYDWATEIVK